MTDLLAVVAGGNLGVFAPIAAPISAVPWVAAAIGAVGGMSALGHAGYRQFAPGAGGGSLTSIIGEGFVGVLGLAFAGLAVTAGTTLAGAVTF